MVQHSPRKTRVSARVKAAIDAMVFDVLPRREAAEKAGLREHSLYKALRKPPTLAYLRAQMEALRTSAGAAAVARIAHLMENATSEHVQLGAAQWMAGIEGVSPVARQEIAHTHRGVTPGLVVITGGWEPHVIEGEIAPAAAPRPSVKVIGTPRSHPLALEGTPPSGRGSHPPGQAVTAEEGEEWP